MTLDQESPGQDLKAVTVRLRMPDYQLLKEYADSCNASLNSVVAEAVAQYGARLKREQAIARIQAFQDRLRSRGPIGTDSVDLLREMRESRGTGCVPETPVRVGPEESMRRDPNRGPTR